MELNARIPDGPLEQKWENYKKNAKLVNPANRKKTRRNRCRNRACRSFSRRIFR